MNRRPLLFLASALLLPACGGGGGGSSSGPPAPMPDFLLVDVNTASTTYNASVSPRDYLTQVSGWYFGHAT